MALTVDQQHQIASRLNSKTGIGGRCPICGSSPMLVAPDVYMIVVYHAETKRVSPDGQPCVSLVCQNCGNSMFFNVYVAGLAEVVGIQVPSADTTSAVMPRRRQP